MSNERYALNKQLAQMLKGGVIMDVTTPEQAKIAEEAGACAVMALERIPADIRAAGGVARMSDPKMIQEIQAAVSIPVMAKCRIGHFVEAQLLQAIEIDYIDESEVLSPADDVYHVNKREFEVPFVCGAKDLGEALRRINEGASMIRTKGEPGTGDIVQAVRHMRMMNKQIAQISAIRKDELFEVAKQLQELTGLEARNTTLGYMQRGGTPTAFDRVLSTKYGTAAMRMAIEEKFGNLVVIKNGKIDYASLEDVVGQNKEIGAVSGNTTVSNQRKVTMDDDLVKTARSVGINLGD